MPVMMGRGEVGHVLGQGQGVEAAHVGRGTAASDDDHHVEVVHIIIYVVQGVDDGRLHLLALHYGREEPYAEREAVVVVEQLVAEVAISRRALA